GAPQPSGELSVGVSGTYRPSAAVSLTAGASALMQSGDAGATRTGLGAEAGIEVTLHPQVTLFGRVQGRLIFEPEAVRWEAEAPATVGLRVEHEKLTRT